MASHKIITGQEHAGESEIMDLLAWGPSPVPTKYTNVVHFFLIVFTEGFLYPTLGGNEQPATADSLSISSVATLLSPPLVDEPATLGMPLARGVALELASDICGDRLVVQDFGVLIVRDCGTLLLNLFGLPSNLFRQASEHMEKGIADRLGCDA